MGVSTMAEPRHVRFVIQELAKKAPQAPAKMAVKLDGRLLFFMDKTFAGRPRFWTPSMKLQHTDQFAFSALRGLSAEDLGRLETEIVGR